MKIKDKILKHSNFIIIVLAIILFSIPIITNSIKEDPLIKGEISYYNINQANNAKWFEPHYLLIKNLNNFYLTFLSPILGLISILLFLKFTKKIEVQKEYTFIFLILVILSPAIISTFSTISINAIYLFYLTLGLYLTTFKKLKYLSIIPLILSLELTIFNSILTILIIILILLNSKNKKFFTSILIISIISSILFGYFLTPFSILNINGSISNLISDFGSTAGMSFFLFFLSIFGIFVTWKNKKIIPIYFLLLIISTLYFFTNEANLALVILLAFFGSNGFLITFKKKWKLNKLKEISIFILFLGLIFSTISFYERFSIISPDSNDMDSLLFIKDNFPKDSIIFSSKDNAYFIKSISQKEPLFLPYKSAKKSRNDTNQILSSLYIMDLFPILEKENIKALYITKDMKKRLPNDQGLLFLLQNKRFILKHQNKKNEVWSFE